jgi:hypothetical protein
MIAVYHSDKKACVVGLCTYTSVGPEEFVADEADRGEV